MTPLLPIILLVWRRSRGGLRRLSLPPPLNLTLPLFCIGLREREEVFPFFLPSMLPAYPFLDVALSFPFSHPSGAYGEN